MTKKILSGAALVLALGGAGLLAPLHAENQPGTCSAGENSNAACAGKWLVFAGNTNSLDEGAWIVRVNSETGEVWYKKGRKLIRLEESD